MTTIRDILLAKNKKKLTMLSTYDSLSSAILQESGIDIILVGDSAGNVILGHSNTLPVTMEEMLFFTKAVRRGAPQAFIVADMPFMSFQNNPEEALKNAGRFIKEAGANAVKIEGSSFVLAIEKILKAGIPVMGHLGYTPQSIHQLGGARIQGKESLTEEKLIKEAEALESLGVFSIVLELMPETVAKKITESLKIPTLGCGAGKHTDGQVLVLHDLLGLTEKIPKFVKRYANFRELAKKAVKQYIKEVENNSYPSKEFSY